MKIAPLAAVLVTGTLVATLTGCSTPTPAATDESSAPVELTTVTVGVTPNTDVAPLFLGQEQGFFEDHGIKLDLQMAQGGAALLPAVVSGDYDFGFSNVASLMVAQTKGLPVKIVAAGAYSTGVEGKDTAAVLTMPGSGIDHAADLEGKTVAVNALKTIFDTTVGYVVDQDGGNAAGINWVEVPWPDQAAALASGQIDAAALVEPFLTIALEQGAVPVAWNWVETDPDLLIAAYFSTTTFIDANPDITAEFAAAVNESLEYAQAHEDEVRDILGTYTEVAPEVRAALTMSRFDTNINRDSVQLLADLSLKYGLVPSKVDVDALLP
jgi:NitT/TauT family transport system substrate-binding protein